MRVRAKELEKFDIFMKQGVKYIVIKKTAKQIFYNAASTDRFIRNPNDFIGANSMEYVEHIGRYEPQFRPKKIIATRQNGDFVGKYNSIKDATEDLGLSQHHIRNYLKGVLKKTNLYGFHFEVFQEQVS